MVDDVLLENFINSFYGYGNPNGDYWFIGKEEGASKTLTENLNRIQVWDNRGQSTFEDVYEYHAAINIFDHWKEKPKLQPTWNKLIRILLVVLGISPTIENVRAYQKEHFGQRHSPTCLPELLPLPSRSTNEWDYSSVSKIPYLENRASYMQALGNKRAKKLRELIQTYAPKLVIFYSGDHWYLEKWESIAGVSFHPENNFMIGQNNQTVFGIIKHPTSFGFSNQYCMDAGILFQKHLSPS